MPDDIDESHLKVLRVQDFDATLEARIAQRTESLQKAETALRALVGLDEVKRLVGVITDQAMLEAERRRRSLPAVTPPLNLVFSGNPGTGKTEVARLLARILAGVGVLESGHLIEVSRADLVGEYVGQTAPKVLNVVDSALGGVLFIDEAYLLSPPDSTRDFGPEAVGTLLTAMENSRADLVVILAGEADQMGRFLAGHPGFAGRFSAQLEFPDYSVEALTAIFLRFAAEARLRVADDVIPALATPLAAAAADPAFDNARAARTLFENAVRAQAERVARLLRTRTDVSDDVLVTLTSEDLIRSDSSRPSGKTTGFYL